MPVVISDEVLKQANLSEREALIEIACRLYDADKLSKPAATRLTGLTRTEFESELLKRGLPWIRVNYSLEEEMRAMDKVLGPVDAEKRP